MNDRASFIDNSGDAAAQVFQREHERFLRDQNRPLVKDALMDRLESGPASKDDPCRAFAEWLVDCGTGTILDILYPENGRTHAEAIYNYRLKFTNDCVDGCGWEETNDRFGLDVGA